MKRTIAAFLVAALLAPLAAAAVGTGDLVFKKTKIVVFEGEKTHEKKAIVTWGEKSVTLQFKNGMDRNRYPEYEMTCAYDKMSDLAYERSKHSRIATAILISPLALFSKRKHHWLSWNFEDDKGEKRSVLLRLDKKEERIYRQRVPNLTGLELAVNIED